MAKSISNGVTLDDIARELGVSNSTVSRALRDDPRISQAVVHKVKNAAARMGYVPNIAARSLRTGQSRMIGLLVRDIRDGGFSIETMHSIEEACAEQGYGLMLCNSNDDPEKEQFYLRVFQQRRVEGVLVVTPTSLDPAAYLPISETMPLVLIDTEFESSPLRAISVDHVLGGYLATRHLLELGHRQVVFLSGPLHLSPCARMVKGYHKAMLEAGIPPEQHRVVIMYGTGLEDGRLGFEEILQLSPRPTALATVSDLMAFGALEATREHQIEVPADFSIVGCDDVSMASLMMPPLTTIAQDKKTLGKFAVELLLEVIEDREEPRRSMLLLPTLIVRDSTAPPPATRD